MKQVGGGCGWGGPLAAAIPQLQHTAVTNPGFLDPLVSQGKPEVWMFLCNILNVQGWQLIFTFSKSTAKAKPNVPRGQAGPRATSLSPWWLALVVQEALNRPVPPKPGTRVWDGGGSGSLAQCGSSYYPGLWEGWAGLGGAGAVGIACRALPST